DMWRLPLASQGDSEWAVASMTVSRRTFRQAYASKLWLAIKWSLTTIGSGENGAMEGDVLSALTPVKRFADLHTRTGWLGARRNPRTAPPTRKGYALFWRRIAIDLSL